MMKIRQLITVAVLSVTLAGCAANGGQYGNKQLGGTLLGGALGGWAGSQIGGGSGKLAATAGGALLGALLGNSIGQSLDRVDRLSVRQTTQVALERAPVGQTTTWRNPDPRRQTYGSVTPTRTYQARGRYCREYQTDITIGGNTERAYGRACRNPDGTWQVVNGDQSSYQQPAPVYQQPAPVYRRPVYQQPAPVHQSAPVYQRSTYQGATPVFQSRRPVYCPKVWVKGQYDYGQWRQGHYRRGSC